MTGVDVCGVFSLRSALGDPRVLSVLVGSLGPVSPEFGAPVAVPGPTVCFVRGRGAVGVDNQVSFGPVVRPVVFVAGGELVICVDFVSFVVVVTPLSSVSVPRFDVRFRGVVRV